MDRVDHSYNKSLFRKEQLKFDILQEKLGLEHIAISFYILLAGMTLSFTGVLASGSVGNKGLDPDFCQRRKDLIGTLA